MSTTSILRYGQLNKQMHRRFNRRVRGVRDGESGRLSGPGAGPKPGVPAKTGPIVRSLDSLFDRYFALPVGSDDAVELLSEIRGRLSPRK